jgi:hypothetical protein
MKKITLILFALFTCWQINAQVSSYAFSQSSGTYTSITGGTVVLSGSALDTNNAAVTLPVTFPFNGSNINSVSVRTDGYLVLGTATTASTAPISSTMAATGIISAFGCDLMDANAAGTIPEVRWEQIGDEIIFQWNDFARYASSTSVEIFDFQIRLNTINGKIDIVYNDFSSTSTSTSYTPQVGLRGSANTDYNARRLTTSVPDATPSWNDTAVATSNAHNVRFTSTSPAAFPSTGLTFTWTPPVPCSGAPVAGTVTPAQQNICSGATPANLVATGFSSGVTGLTFQWEESDDDGATDAWTAVTGATTATFTPPVFSGTPIYYRLNVTCSNSTTSAQTASVLVATPLAPTTQTSLVTIPVASVSYNSAVINWTNGNGPRRVVYISDSATFTDPVNGNTAALVANSVYSGSGQQIILDGTGSTVTVTGLAIGTQYYVKSYEYLRCGSGPYDYYYNVTTGSNIGNFTTCGAYTVPATEDFTTYVPGCWQEADNGNLVAGPATFGTSSWAAEGFGNVGTAGATRINLDATGDNDWILSPLYTIPANYELKFDAAANQWGTSPIAPTSPWEADDFVEVLVSTATSNWTVLYTYNNTNVPSNTGTSNIIDLDAYAGQTVRFAFRGVEGTTDGSSDIEFMVDNFELRQTPSCIEPTGLVVSNIASTGATISWNAVNPAPSTGYEYYYSNVNTAPSVAGTAINALTNNLSGLTPNTTYYVWLRSDCGGIFSSWFGPITFTTACEAITIFPHTEDFEANNPCWTNLQVSGTSNWVRDADGDSGDISTAHGGTGFMEKNYQSSEALLFSPAFDFTALGTDGRVRVWLHRHGSADVNDEYTVYVNTSRLLTGATQLLNLYSLTSVSPTVSSTGWYEYVINIPSTFNTSSNVYIIFQGVTSAGFSSYDLGVDDFVLEAVPSCIEPTGLVVSNIATTGATISWNAVNPAPSTGYEYYYSNVNTAPSVAGTAINALTDNLSGLTPNTTYYVWLRSDCGSGSFSAWVGPVTFYTGYCTPSSTESTSYVDNFTTSGGSQNISNLTSGFTAGGYLNATSQVVESYENGSFDFNATIQGPTVGFAIWIDWNNNLVFEASEKVYNTTSYGSGPFSGTITVPVGTALGDYRMRITTDWNASNPSDPCAAADRAEFEDYTLTVGAQPACLPPNTIIASNITSNSVDLSWTDGSGGLQFDYEYAIQAPGTGEPTTNGAPIGDVTVVDEGFDIDGNPLTPNTLYEVYVRADCGGSFSTWTGPITFTTLCEAFSVPFSEGFNSTSTTESCWTKLNVNADGDEWNTNYTTNPFEGDQVAVMYTDYNAGANDDWLISPTITLTGNQRLKFHYRVQSAGEPNDFELLLSTTGTATASFTNTLIANTSYSNITYVEQIVDLSAYSGDVNIAWHVPNGGLDGWRLYIDNVIVEDIPLTPPSCATNILGTPDANCGNFANSITWDATPLADGYYVTIGTSSGANDIADSVSLPSSTLTYSFTGTINTTYYYTIIPFNANGSATGCTEQSFTTNANGCYCVSAPTSVDGTGITNVQLVATDFANTVSTAPVYNDHTATVVDMSQGINNNVQITFDVASWSGSYDYNTVIWIDANDNFTFESSEIVYTGVSATTAAPTLLNASFVMPGTAPLGQHRMRIVATDNLQTPSNPCYSGTYGETADFTINVVAPTCTPPAATTSVVYDCSASQFSVAVNVSALGNGSPSISNGTTTWPVTATGVVNAGPFNFGAPVTLTLLHGTDASCNLPLGIFNYGGCPPVNDDCSNATVLTPGGVFGDNDVVGTNEFSSASTGAPAPGCALYSGGDVWYSAVVPASGSLTFEVNTNTGGITDGAGAVYSGTCGALVLVDCDDSSSATPNDQPLISVTGRTPGEVLYFRVWEYGNNSFGTFKVSAYDASLSSGSFDNNSFVAYPNPVKDIFNVSYSSEISAVRVLNLLGQEVISQEVNTTSTQIDMSQLSTGTYIVNVTVGGAIKVIKVVKQ